MLLASSEYRHALETDIEPFKGLLLGLFFISVGMAIDFGLLLAGFLALKTAMLWLLARLIDITPRQRGLFALLLSQGGEFAFVVFAAAQGARLTAADAGKARLLVNAIDDVDDSIALVDLVRAHFPQLKIVARARNVRHYVELRTRQVEVIERETFEAALKTGRHVLEALGIDPYRAREMADAFRRHNVATMESLIPHFHDENRMLTVARAGREELEELFSRDREKFEEKGKGGWS